jgi:thiol-disulfide isomerase/thioredoxin
MDIRPGRYTLAVKSLCLAAALAAAGHALADTALVLDERTPATAAALVTAARGTPVMVILYASTCSRSRAAFPKILELAKRRAGKGAVLAFAVDQNPEPLRQFLLGRALPFPPVWIKPWQKGELVKAFKPLGVNVAGVLEMPLVAVIKKDGTFVQQWSPALDLTEAEAALTAAESP